MTDEERQKLISTLRSIAVWQGLTPVREAADEIERLADITERYKKLSKYLCTIIREKLNELEGINND